MRCKPCGAPRSPSADRCDYCQSWHERRFEVGRIPAHQNNAALNSPQSAMMAQDAQYQIQRSYLSGLGNAYAGIGGLLGRGF